MPKEATVKLTYQESGVDPDKADTILESFSDFLKSRPRDPNLLSGIGPYASCYRLSPTLKDMKDPLLVTCCDGVGTKVKLALDWGKLDTLGEDLVAMNVNDMLCVGALPTAFLDYYACGKLDSRQLGELLKSIQKACEMAGCVLAGGETAEMPGMYSGKDFDLAGFSVGIVDSGKMLGSQAVQEGDSLVAIASSGVHSNGYSLVRKIVEKNHLNPDEKNPFDGRTWRETLLAPTIIYVPHLREKLNSLHGLAHITGGGLFGNLPRILSSGQKAVVDSKRWPFSPLFRWLQKEASLSDQELLSTFNAGVGIIAALPASSEADFLSHCKKKGLHAVTIGQVAKSSEAEPHVEWK